MTDPNSLDRVIAEMQECFDGTERPVPPPHALHRWCSNLVALASRAGDAPPDPDFAAVRTAVREAFDRDAPKLAELCCESRPAALSIADMRHWLGNAVAVAFKLRGASRVPVGDATLREFTITDLLAWITEWDRAECERRMVTCIIAPREVDSLARYLVRAASPVPKEKP